MPTRVRSLLPGLALTSAIALAAAGTAAIERRMFGSVIVDGLVIAILIGMLVRVAAPSIPRTGAGIEVAAKQVLEIAILFLGASVDLPALLRAGPALAVGIVLLVALALLVSYSIGRALRLPHSLAVLVATGNAICGIAAIAAVAPVIRAPREHVVSAIGFAAVLGLAVVLGLPLLIAPLGLSDYQYGVLAGLTGYSVPQALAAALPVSVIAGQMATVVKLVRVLMLGPVVMFFTLTHRHARDAVSAKPGSPSTPPAPAARMPIDFARLVPWFIIGFVVLAGLRSAGVIPDAIAENLRFTSRSLMLVAMAALGLGVDLSIIREAGRSVVLAASASVAALVLLSLGLIQGLGIR